MNGRLKWIGLLMIIGLLMVGCTEEDTVSDSTETLDQIFEEAYTEQDERLNELLPEGVKDGTVTQEVYLEATRIIKELPEYGVENNTYIQQLKDSNVIVGTIEFKDEYGSFLNKYDVFIKGFSTTSSTSADFEINKHIVDIVFNTEMYIDSMRSYLDKEDFYYRESASEYSKKRQVSLEALVNSMDKHGLFIEK